MHDLLVDLLGLLAQLLIASGQAQQRLGTHIARSRCVGGDLLINIHGRLQVAVHVFFLDARFEAHSSGYRGGLCKGRPCSTSDAKVRST